MLVILLTGLLCISFDRPVDYDARHEQQALLNVR